MSFFTGYLAEGIGGPNGFTENTASGYARQAVTFGALNGGTASTIAPVQFACTTNTTVTQRALYDASTGGNLIMWWNLANPPTILAGGFDTVKVGTLAHSYPALYDGMGSGTAEVDFLNGTVIGATSEGKKVFTGHYLYVQNGTIAAKSSV